MNEWSTCRSFATLLTGVPTGSFVVDRAARVTQTRKSVHGKKARLYVLPQGQREPVNYRGRTKWENFVLATRSTRFTQGTLCFNGVSGRCEMTLPGPPVRWCLVGTAVQRTCVKSRPGYSAFSMVALTGQPVSQKENPGGFPPGPWHIIS